MTSRFGNRAQPFVRRALRLLGPRIVLDAEELPYVASVLEGAYRITPSDIRRTINGDVSHSFVIHAADNARWFVKLSVSGVCYGPPDRKTALMATRELPRYVDAFTIVEPLMTSDGHIAAEGARGTVSVFPLMAGKTLPPKQWSDQTLARVAKGIAQVHAARPAIFSRPARYDAEHYRFASILDAYDELSLVAPAGTDMQRNILALLRRHWSDLEPIAQRYLSLRAAVQAMSNDFVISHTDLHGSNILVSKSGDVAVVDWEGLAYAPAEFDVYALLQPSRMRLVVDAYREVRERFDPREEVMTFLFLDDLVGRYPALQLCRLIETADDAEKQATYGGRLRSLIAREADGKFEARMEASLTELQNAAAR